MKQYKLVSIKQLKFHEKINYKKLNILINQLRQDEVLKKPILVEKNFYVVLDGHHRVSAFKKIGLKQIPAILVSYNRIKVKLRRKIRVNNIKKEVIKRAIKNDPFPPKNH